MRTAALAAWTVWLIGSALARAATPCPEAQGNSAPAAQDWIGCGLRAQQAGRYADAQQAFDQARELAERSGDRSALAAALEGAGDARQLLGHLTDAEPLLRQSLKIREELGDQAGIALSLAALGRFYITAGDDPNTREYFERSRKLNEQLGNRLGVAMALNNIGISWKIHDVLIALDYFEKSLDELTRLGEERRANIVRTNVALMYYELGDIERSIELAQAALEVWNRIGVGDRGGVAETTLGIAYLELGDYRTALRFLSKALAERQKLDYPFGIAESWNNLALVYRAQGAHEQAQSALEKTIALSHKLDNQDLESEALGNLGQVQYLAGHPAEAVKSLKASLSLLEKEDAKFKIGFVACYLGALYLSQHKLNEASQYLEQSLKAEEQTHDGLNVGQTLVALSDLERQRGNLEKSRQFALRAVDVGAKNAQADVQWTALTALGHVEKALGHREAAQSAFDRAIAVLEELRTRVAGGESQIAIFFANKIAPYQERMALSLESGNTAEAFSYAERARARSLLDTISGGRPPLTKSMTADERAEERRLRLALNAVSKQLQSAPDNGAELRKRQDQARRDYESFQAALYAAHPELRLARAQTPAIAAGESLALMPGASSAQLEFAVTENRTWLFVLTSRGLRSFELRVSRAALEQQVGQFRQQLANRDLRVDRAARELYALLLAPAASALAGTSEWIVAPDGPLWDLPFQALQSKPGRFLIEDSAISYVQSFTALREEMHAATRRRTAPSTLLGFGDPAGRDPLPEAARQIQAIAAMYQPSSRAYLGADASEARVKQEAPRYRILQFATHAVFDDRSPLYSYVALAQPAPATSPSSSDDGLLEAWEIMQLDLNADLAVLSACETARGRLAGGEGLIGLTWALFVAGSPSALVTQWKVDSAATGDLMIEFHRSWHGGAGNISKAKALQTAQLHMLHQPGSHPFDWAGVMLIGDSR